MTTITYLDSDAIEDEFPQRIVCSSERTDDPSSVIYRITATGGGYSSMYELEVEPTGTWWQEAVAFLESITPTSIVGTMVAPLSDDEHPQPESADRVRFLHSSSGLTWDQLARAFGVSRRSLHAWARGGRMNSRNMERLAVVESTLSASALPTPADTRQALLATGPDGTSVFQNLVASAHAVSRRSEVDPARMLLSSGDGPNVPGSETAYTSLDQSHLEGGRGDGAQSDQ